MIFKLSMTTSFWLDHERASLYESVGFQFEKYENGRVKLLHDEVEININSIEEIFKIMECCKEEQVVLGYEYGVPFIEIYNGYRE